MKLIYKNTALDIYINEHKIDYDLNNDHDLKALKKLFNNSIAQLSEKHNKLEYWLMRISERNTLSNNLFLDICRISMLENYLSSHKNIKIFTNNLPIYTYFRNNISMSHKDRFLFELRKFTHEFKPYLGVLKFIFKKIIFFIKYRNKKYAINLSNTTILQTWVNDNNFINNAFHDNYFGDISSYLKKNAKKVLTWPIFYDVKNIKKTMHYIRREQSNFLIMEDYLEFKDYFFAISLFFKKRFLNLGNIFIDNENFTSVFKYYQKRESVDYESLFFCFAMRLNKANNNNITFIQLHENMIPEKALILGVNKYLKDSSIVGYFHTTKPNNQLCLEYANESEYKIAPKPSAIIFNSSRYKSFFESKYKSINALNGVAFKQLHLKKITADNVKFNEILILFSGTTDEIEFTFSLLNNVKKDYKFLFRMHPMKHFNVKEYYNYTNFKIVNDMSINKLLRKSGKIVSTYSSIALEYALRGREIGLIYDKHKLLFNPFDDTDIKNYKLISSNLELDNFFKHKIKVLNNKNFFNLKEEDYRTFLEIT